MTLRRIVCFFFSRKFSLFHLTAKVVNLFSCFFFFAESPKNSRLHKLNVCIKNYHCYNILINRIYYFISQISYWIQFAVILSKKKSNKKNGFYEHKTWQWMKRAEHVINYWKNANILITLFATDVIIVNIWIKTICYHINWYYNGRTSENRIFFSFRQKCQIWYEKISFSVLN